jgi:hypothetical protein
MPKPGKKLEDSMARVVSLLTDLGTAVSDLNKAVKAHMRAGRANRKLTPQQKSARSQKAWQTMKTKKGPTTATANLGRWSLATYSGFVCLITSYSARSGSSLSATEAYSKHA